LSLDNNIYEIWLLDSGCSNERTRQKDIFFKIEESTKFKVVLGYDKPLELKGK
jgi:hypothetical protein